VFALVAGPVHRTGPLLWVGFPSIVPPAKMPPVRVAFLLVEPRGIEPLSESNLEGTSPGAVCYLHFLNRTGTNTLPVLVAS